MGCMYECRYYTWYLRLTGTAQGKRPGRSGTHRQAARHVTRIHLISDQHTRPEAAAKVIKMAWPAGRPVRLVTISLLSLSAPSCPRPSLSLRFFCHHPRVITGRWSSVVSCSQSLQVSQPENKSAREHHVHRHSRVLISGYMLGTRWHKKERAHHSLAPNISPIL